jgi:low affinity Fe/Cu permease
MARKRTNGAKHSGNSHTKAQSERGNSPTLARHERLQQSRQAAEAPHAEWFSSFAHAASRVAGKPIAFILATAAVLAWATTGPYFGYSDTWQLVINTSTTIITFLMVFLIQNTQNRDSAAMQLKLDELIRAINGAHNGLLDLEELSDEELDRIKGHYEALARKSREELRRGLKDTGTIKVPTSS